MEIAASIFILLAIYFLGAMSIAQEIVKSDLKEIKEEDGKTSYLVSGFKRTLAISLTISLLATAGGYFLFVI